MRLRISEAASAMGGRLAGADGEIQDVVVDSREARCGSLFFALPGARTDGHRFVEAAFLRGATAAVVSRSTNTATHAAHIEVADPGRALLDLARWYRRRLSATVVGITGSVGKTTTKDLAAAVLGAAYEVVASARSFNNEIGVPLTVLAARETTRMLVAEIGAGAVGEIRGLCDVARPHIGVVTVVGPAHLETFGSLDAIARAKAELVEALPRGGLAVLNADDPVVASFGKRALAPVLTYGCTSAAAVRGRNVRLSDRGRSRFDVEHGTERASVELPVIGEHFVTAALAAIACGVALGVPIERAADRLRVAAVSPGRMQEFSTPNGVRVVHDAYNANPTSMRAALEATARAAGRSRAIAVLGPMEQLGQASRSLHEAIGAIVAELDFDGLILVGERANAIGEGAIRAGMPFRRVVRCADPEDAAAAVLERADRDDVVLIKASRAACLEDVVDALCRPHAVGPDRSSDQR